MARRRQYLDMDVLTAARERIRHIADTHDTVVVCFSGGKDSLAVLHLVREVLGASEAYPVDVVFRDEELIPDAVIDFVNHYRELEWVRMLWFAVPFHSTKFILGRSVEYVQWDPNRPHLREKPEHAISLPPGDDRVFDQYIMDNLAVSYYRGKVALLNGMRAEESIIRYQSCMTKLNENYINACSSKRASLCKPIYDWREDDVFKYFYDNQIRYCAVYDSQHVNRGKLRVSTPLHAEHAKVIGLLRSAEPDFYQRIVSLFPEMKVQERYWGELDRAGLKRRYGQSMAGIRAYIQEEIQDEGQQRAALLALSKVEQSRKARPESYPPEHVFRYIISGAYKRNCMPKTHQVREATGV